MFGVCTCIHGYKFVNSFARTPTGTHPHPHSHTHTHTHQALPFPKDVVSQLDYNSRLRLTLCFFRLKSLLESNTTQETMELESDVTDLESRLKLKVQEGMQLVKQDSKSPRSVPGMLQDMMSEVCLSQGRVFCELNFSFELAT